MLNKEEWRDVPDFEGLYQVSNYGRVRSVSHFVRSGRGRRKIKGRLLKPVDRGTGYAFVTMGKDGKQYNVSIHRIVGLVFIPNPDNLPILNHIDENGMNPRADNLEWCTFQYNNTYNRRAIFASEKRAIAIDQLSMDGVFVARHKSLSEASRTTNISVGNISCCLAGKRGSAGGYKWVHAKKVSAEYA